MSDKLKIAGYCRISVDEELDKDNTSIENQKAIIADYVSRLFPESTLDFYEDRDRSGYTFEQRESYQALRKKIFRKEYDILIVKDFSRFSRRTSKGLVELEDLRDIGMRIISIGDGIDYPTSDDWTAIQFRFLINEMPVTDTSKKVKTVIKHRQEEGKWVCAVPYGYIMVNSKTMKFIVDEPSAEIVREIFQLYSEGWGYKKIANYLTQKHIPTPRTTERLRREENGEEYKVQSREEWSIVSISHILTNDFYIGTLRERKYRRKKINGGDMKLQETEHLVFENNHTPIVDYKLFANVQEQMKTRSTSNYRGVKKYDNVYSGHIFCGDCGSPMFSMSRGDLAQAYRCGMYHKFGLNKCTSHHTRVDMLDEILKSYIRKVKDNSESMLEQLQESIDKEQKETSSSKDVIKMLEQQIEDVKTEIKLLNRQHVKDLAKHPEREDILEELHQEQIDELTLRIEGLKNQIQLASEKHNMIVSLNRTAKTVIEVFDNILNKESLSKADIDFIVDKIMIYTDHIDIMLKPDIDELLKIGIPEELQFTEETAVNFKQGTKNSILQSPITRIRTSKGEILSVNVINEGDPLEIYTSSDGEVIFKKYSAIGEMSENASQVADIMYKLAGCPVVVFDRDHVVATSGVTKREFQERRVSPELEELMEARKQFFAEDGARKFYPVEGVEQASLAATPILTAGDVTGAVAFLSNGRTQTVSELQKSLVNAAAQFLGRQVE
ncbi:MAG: stage V sporulation T C-terminal domain-containing protein [Oscillospiraceae bacterium]